MWLKKYFVRKGETAHKFYTCSIYNRSPERQWNEDHTPEVMDWLWKHKMIKWSEPYIQLGENPTGKFIAYTKLGRKLRAWYECSYWHYFKYYILNKTFWEYKVYYPIMINVFGKHYDWQDYE
jgi:hypothetical protein